MNDEGLTLNDDNHFCCFVATILSKSLVINTAGDGGRGGSKYFCYVSATVSATAIALSFLGLR